MAKAVFLVGGQGEGKTSVIRKMIFEHQDPDTTFQVREINFDKATMVSFYREMLRHFASDKNEIIFVEMQSTIIRKWRDIPDHLANTQADWYRVENGKATPIRCTFEGLQNTNLSTATK